MSKKIVTAGVILIGDELLSGRTQDTNLSSIARWLEPLGVQVGEARIVADNAETISATVRSFSERFNYVFTTGGIGPTHDDITADCIAAAFGLGISEREDAIGEGDAAGPLAEIEKTYQGVSIGSYPFFNAELRGVNFVARGQDEEVLDKAESALKAMVEKLKAQR